MSRPNETSKSCGAPTFGRMVLFYRRKPVAAAAAAAAATVAVVVRCPVCAASVLEWRLLACNPAPGRRKITGPVKRGFSRAVSGDIYVLIDGASSIVESAPRPRRGVGIFTGADIGIAVFADSGGLGGCLSRRISATAFGILIRANIDMAVVEDLVGLGGCLGRSSRVVRALVRVPAVVCEVGALERVRPRFAAELFIGHRFFIAGLTRVLRQASVGAMGRVWGRVWWRVSMSSWGHGELSESELLFYLGKWWKGWLSLRSIPGTTMERRVSQYLMP